MLSNLQEKRKEKKRIPRFRLGDLVRSAVFKKVFSKGGSTNWSYKLYTFTEVLHDTIPSYMINYLLERFNENLFRLTKITLEENNKVMKELNLIQ